MKSIKNFFHGIYRNIRFKFLIMRLVRRARRSIKMADKIEKKYLTANNTVKDSPFGPFNAERDTIDAETLAVINAEAEADLNAELGELNDTLTDIPDMSDTGDIADIFGITEDKGGLFSGEMVPPWRRAAMEIKKEQALIEDVKGFDDKRFSIVTLNENATAEDCRKMNNMRSNKRYCDYVKLPVGGRDIFKNGNVEFTFKGIPCSLSETDKTVMDNELTEGSVYCVFEFRSEYYRLKDEPEAYPCECVGIMSEKTFQHFEKEGNEDSVIKNMKEYFKLSDAQREYVRKMADRPADSEVKENRSIYIPLNDSDSLMMLYETCKESYPKHIRAKAELLFDRLEKEGYGSRRAIQTQLAYTLGINTVAGEHPVRSYDEVIDILDKHIYGMNELKTALAEHYIAMQHAGEKGCLILIVGPPGVGKTSVCEALAELWDIPLAHVDCTGVDGITIGGLISSYTDARPGKVVDSLYSAGTADVVLRLDELDKMQKSPSNGGDPYSVFTKPFGPQRVFYDEFVGDIDLRSTKIIATANDSTQIPGYILNRFEDNVFYISAYSADDKYEIGRNYLIPKQLKSFGIPEGNISFTDGAVRLIAKSYCDDEGARYMEGYIKQLIRKVIADQDRGRLKMPFTIDEDYVKERITKKTDTKVRKIGIAV